MNVLQNGNEIPPSGPAPDYSSGYGIVPIAGWPAAEMPAFPLYLQWQDEGVDLGDRGVRVVNFVTDPTVWLVTRGVGEQSNVITIGAAPVPPIPPIVYDYSYYTSLFYPYLNEESISVGPPRPTRGWIFPYVDALNLPPPTIESGTLGVTIVYKSYTNHRDVNPDTMNHPVPPIQSGTLDVTIDYVEYLNLDTMNHPVSTIQSGVLEVVIAYISYEHKRDVNPDTMNHPVTTIQSGSLA